MAPALNRPTSPSGAWSTPLAGALGLVVLVLLGLWVWMKPHRAPVVMAESGAVMPSVPAAAPAHTEQPLRESKPSALEARRSAAAAGQWSKLTPSEQRILSPLAEDWSELTRDQRAKWFDLAQRFPSMLPDDQQRIQGRMADWARMTPTERGAARLNFQEIRQLSAKERLERWEAYQGLDADERKQLAERGQAVSQGPQMARRSDQPAPVQKSTGSITEALAAQAVPLRSVGGTVVQAPMGATTLLVSRLPSSSSSAGSGPKIAATADFVDPATLLPQVRAARIPTVPAAASPSGDAGSTGDAPPESGTNTDPPSTSGG